MKKGGDPVKVIVARREKRDANVKVEMGKISD